MRKPWLWNFLCEIYDKDMYDERWQCPDGDGKFICMVTKVSMFSWGGDNNDDDNGYDVDDYDDIDW